MGRLSSTVRYRGYCIIRMVFLISLCFLSAGIFDAYSAEPSYNVNDYDLRNILILNSYNEGYRWTSEQSNAICDKLKPEFDDILIFVEYMDTKYHPEKGNIQKLYELYKYKYANTKLDLIFTTDNAALEFALEHRKELFSDAPIIFSGITKEASYTILKDRRNVAGVFEIHDPVGTMKAASAINPEIKDVYVIFDNTDTGKDSKNVILENKIQDKYNLFFLNELTIDQIVKEISKLDKNSIVLMGAYTIDAHGLKRPADKFVEIISNASSVPVYDMWNFRMGNGVLGGSLLRGISMGDSAAKLGISVLKGQDINTIENIDDKVVEYIFDYNQMERFNVPIKALPKGSIILNKPFSFIETYRNLVIGTVLTFTIMCVYILVLINNIRKRKKAEQEVNEANEELTALYEQVSAAEEQLKYQLSELVLAHDNLQVSEEKYRLVAEAANDIIWEWELGSNKLQFSSRLKGTLGYGDDEIKSIEDWNSIVSTEDIEYVRSKMESFFDEERKDCTCEYRVRHKKGKTLWLITKAKVLFDQLGYPYKIVGSHTDITQLKEHQNRIMQMAYHDMLTQLPNRSYLKEYVDEQISGAPDSLLAIIYIDIDDFKTINDNFGHSEGDKFLIEIGNMFSSMCQEDSMIFRLGGDEYVIVLNEVRDRMEVADYLKKIYSEFEKPINLADRNLHITLSAGAVVYPMDGVNFDDLLKNADIAMYHVKNKGKNNFVFFDESMRMGIMEKMHLENSLREAVRDMKFTLSYQPIFDVTSGKIKGLEALIRWNSPELGPVPPSVFINLAEQNGLIIPIGNWVLKTGCCYAAKLAAEGYPDICISINISPIQLMQADFVPKVMNIVRESGVEPDRIELEITESILIDSFESSLKKLIELREFGLNISLDDFGQGYSSLTYLRRLPINTLKIDKAFIDDIFKSDSNNQVVYAIIELAHRMRLKVTAEGVETEEQLQCLRDIDCDYIQGYLISKPVPEGEVIQLLDKVGQV